MAEEKKEEKNSQKEEDVKEEKSTATAEDATAEKAEEKKDTEEEPKDKKSTDNSDKDDEKEVEVPEKFKSLVEEIEKMSVLDLSELVKVLEKKFGVSAAAPVATVSAGQGNGENAAEEKSIFNVELKSVGDKKIEVIKAVRDLMGKGLKEAKDLVDAVANGAQVLKENAKKEEAEDIKKKFEAAGATVELK